MQNHHRHHHHPKPAMKPDQLEVNISLESKNKNSAVRSGEEFKDHQDHQLYPLQMEDKETGPRRERILLSVLNQTCLSSLRGPTCSKLPICMKLFLSANIKTRPEIIFLSCIPILDMQWTVTVWGTGGNDLCVLSYSSQRHYIMISLDRHTFKTAKRTEHFPIS